MLETYFNYVLNMSITSSYVIVAVLLIRLLLTRFAKKYSYFLWGVVGFRLAVPISFSSVFSLFSLKLFDMHWVHDTETGTMNYIQPVDPVLSRVPSVDVGIETANELIQNAAQADLAAVPTTITFQQVFSYIWIIIASALILYGMISYIVLKLKLSNAVLKKDNIYESDRISSPFILGFIPPKIYIPFGIDEKTYQYVIAHERCHIRRCDYYVKAFACVILAMHWFNPLVWLAFVLMTRDMEMSCDEMVLAENENIKKDYGSAILSFASGRNNAAVTPLCFSENSIRARIKNVLRYKKPGLIVSIIAVVLCAALVIACAANPKEDSIAKIDTLTVYDIGDMNIGAELPQILYADDEEIIMHGTFGIIRYNYKHDILLERVNALTIMNLGFHDPIAMPQASADGKNVYLYDGTENSPIVCIDFKHGYLKEVSELPGDLFNPLIIENEFSGSYSQFFDGKYLNSLVGARLGGNLLYLRANNDWSMKSLELVICDLYEDRILSISPVFGEYYYQNSVKGTTESFLDSCEYIGFECSGDYYCFDRENMKNSSGTEFFVEMNGDSRIITALYRGNKTTVFNSAVADNSTIQLRCFIDDALYFSLDNGALLRYSFDLNEDGYIVDSELSLICREGYYIPVKAEKNTLILSADMNYYALNTKTGAMSRTQYHVTVNSDDIKGIITFDEAARIVHGILQNTKPNIFEEREEENTFENYTPDKEQAMLIYKPDIPFSEYAYKPYPEYAWYIVFSNENWPTQYYVMAYVDAQTGELVNLSIEFND